MSLSLCVSDSGRARVPVLTHGQGRARYRLLGGLQAGGATGTTGIKWWSLLHRDLGRDQHAPPSFDPPGGWVPSPVKEAVVPATLIVTAIAHTRTQSCTHTY